MTGSYRFGVVFADVAARGATLRARPAALESEHQAMAGTDTPVGSRWG